MRVKNAIRLGVGAVTVAAVAQELRLPPEERTWHGEVGGVIPYDFRTPTPARLRQRLWAPDGALVQPQTFGVGWTVNVGRAVRLLRERRAAG